MPASVRTPSTSMATRRTRRNRASKAWPSCLGACDLPRGIDRPGLVGRHHLFELPRDRLLVPSLRQRLQLTKMAVELTRTGTRLAHRPLDLLVRGWLDALVLVEKFLIHFLAPAKASIDDLDVLVRDMPGQENHVAGQVRDPDLLAHVQDEHITPLAHHARLED